MDKWMRSYVLRSCFWRRTAGFGAALAPAPHPPGHRRRPLSLLSGKRQRANGVKQTLTKLTPALAATAQSRRRLHACGRRPEGSSVPGAGCPARPLTPRPGESASLNGESLPRCGRSGHASNRRGTARSTESDDLLLPTRDVNG